MTIIPVARLDDVISQALVRAPVRYLGRGHQAAGSPTPRTKRRPA